MLKIFLVEDEIIVREGIKNNINWQENGYFFCGEASDGELAYPLIQKLKPDIVITDIRMPFLDGLQLSRLIRLDMPWIKIIILSGYGEFEYAKQAIDIGVTKYLLKPINGTELLNCMKLVGEDIYKEQREKANLDKFKCEMKEYELDERRRLFHDLVSSEQTLANILVRGNELSLELSAMAYNIILFTLKYEHNTKLQYDNYSMKVRCELEELFEKEENIIKFDFLIDGMALLIKGGSIGEILGKQEYYIKQIKEIMEYYPILYFGGIGIPVTRLGELRHSYHEASRAFAYRYIWSNSEILDSSLLVDDGVSMDDYNITGLVQLDKKKVVEFLKSGTKEEIDYFVDEYLKCIGTEVKNSLLFRHYIVMDMTNIASGMINELGGSYDIVNHSLNKKEQFQKLLSSFMNTKSYIKSTFGTVIDIRDEIMSKDEKLIINKAKSYINDNYYNEEMSLNLVAESVYISPNHFSALFKKKTGETFIKYLTDLRMSKAKELLRFTDMRTSEVGFAVGYKDPQYFSFLFKKTQNCTPKQYREETCKRREK